MRRHRAFGAALACGASAAMALAIGVSGAAAATGTDTLSCTFSASTTEFDALSTIPDDAATNSGGGAAPFQAHTPAGNVPADIPDLHGLPGAGDVLDTTAGHFVLKSNPAVGATTCVHTDADGQVAGESGGDNTDVYPAWINASGLDWSLVCGMGTARGQAVITMSDGDPTAGAAPSTGTARGQPDTELDPAGGSVQGVALNFDLALAGGQGAISLDGSLEADPARKGSGAGVFSLNPHKQGNEVPCATGQVTGFDVTGTFTWTESA
jgi:hypothetical protein